MIWKNKQHQLHRKLIRRASIAHLMPQSKAAARVACSQAVLEHSVTKCEPGRPNPDRCPTHPGALLREDIIPAEVAVLAEAGLEFAASVFWSEEDHGFIAVATDLPGCSAFGETQPEALAELQDAITAWIEAAKASSPNR